LTAIALMILPLLVFVVLVKLLPPGRAGYFRIRILMF